jgi:hypothetical protein
MQEFTISIGSCPNLSSDELEDGEYLNHDLNMVKAALLYADKITLCSPSCTMVASIASLGELIEEAPLKQKLEFLREILPAENKLQLDQFSYILKKKRLSKEELLLKIKLNRKLDEMWNEFKIKGYEIADKAKLEGFIKAHDAGILDFYDFKQLPSGKDGNSMVKEYIEYISKSIHSAEAFPFLDDFSGSFIKSLIDEKKISFSNLDSERMKHLSLVANLFEKLPILELASIDELLDIRKELNPYLNNFRKQIFKFSNEIKSEIWEDDFKKEIEHIFLKDITPALSEIEDSIRSNRYLKTLTRRYADKPSNFSVPILSLAAANYANISEYASIVASGASVIANAYAAYSDWDDNKKRIESNNLFFYYYINKKL